MRSFVRILMLSCIALLLVSTSMAVGITPPPTTVAWSGLQAAIDAASTGDTITLTTGTYESTSTITINKNVTVDGNGSTVNVAGVGKDPWRYVFIIPAAGAGATVQNFTINKTDKAGEFNLLAIQANDVTIQDNTFTGQFAIGDGDVTRAMEVSGGLSGLSIDGNTISGLRQPAYFNPGTVGTVSDNNVDATKGWVVIGATITFTGNTWGTNAVDIYLGDGTPFGAPYDPLSAMSTANDSANIEDGRTGVNPYRVTNTTKGTAYTTIQAAVDAADAGDVIDVAAGTYAEANINISKALTLQGPNAAINPNTGVRVDEAELAGTISKLADDVTIKGIKFTGARGIVPSGVANFTLVRNIFTVDAMALYNEGTGNDPGFTNAQISENRFVACGGTGIFLGHADGVSIDSNEFHNIAYCAINMGGGVKCENVSITNNIINGTDAQAIQFANTTGNSSISGNTITNTGFTPNEDDKGGIRLYGDDFFGTISITDNEITNSHRALCVKNGKDITGKTITVTGNTFGAADAANDLDIWHGGTGTLTVTGNTFTGATTDQDIEDKVWHDVDDATLGHVDWGQGAATECALVVSDLAGNAGQTLQLTAKLTADGTGLSGQPVSFQVNGADAGTGTTDIAGVAVAPHTIAAGDTTITATFAGVSNYVATTSNEGTITAGAAKATGITLALDTDDVVSGDAVTCTVTGDNGEDYTATAKYYVDRAAGGTWAGNVYTSAKAGAWTVTAVVDTLTTTANLAVDHGDAVDVTITPEEATINAGGSQEYVVTATDAAGNTWSPAGVLGEDGAGALNGNTYESVEGDAGTTVTITATVNGETATSTLNINAAAGPGLILAWDVDDMAFYLCSNATDPADGGVPVTDGMTLTVEGNDNIPVTVSGGGTDVTVTIGTSSLRVQWYVRRGSLTKVYQYSTIDGNELTATYDARRTLVDGTWQTGFWGLTHTIGAETITYGSALQQGIE